MPILKRVLRFQRWSITTAIIAKNSGIPLAPWKILTPFRQYTTKITMIAGGSVLPRYFMVGGNSLFPPNTQKGSALVNNVHAATTKIIVIECSIFFLLLSK